MKCPDVPSSSVLELIEARRSIFPKDYTGECVEEALVSRLLEAARWAPTHGKTEPWRFTVYAGDGRERLLDATLAFYGGREEAFWSSAWNGEFADFAAYRAYFEKQREAKWLPCSHLVSICMRRQQPEAGKRLYPVHEEVAAVACAVQNMHLLATSMRLGAYWSSWFEHFRESPEGVEFHGLCPAEGDLWLGVFCIGQSNRLDSYRATRRPVDEIAAWQTTRGDGQ